MDDASHELDLVSRSQRGDREAFEELIRRVARPLYARIYLDVGDVHAAEDLVQETLLKAWRELKTLERPSGFRGWVNAIAHRTVVDNARRSGRKKRSAARTTAGDMDRLPTHTQADPAAAAECNDDRQAVLAQLRNLPASYREVLSMRYLLGHDHDEIAKQLALSNGSLRGLLNRGLAMLREKLRRPSSPTGADTSSLRSNP